ncbi:hypothetical protein C7974DRAFT_194780 [Boeremia exigua]|uniref:uncharacterized protein n=1 Tax=Boeremia exigua TaxID=749465 RepID=UPI001E8E46BE|nr:uncharacterized protein C7974DRAFT_85221 [Boeremia exigua]XP_045997643.1 uncharacterized protein C7974DRAFT_194780 [Boeremia exigua]KAH6612776.1 hypothetical protein C7974DRAFT_85221 [Boeremia exigua]KAH6629875.1 hypothetical protein C7974DRAFT_194780 [Boeremia exigua]
MKSLYSSEQRVRLRCRCHCQTTPWKSGTRFMQLHLLLMHILLEDSPQPDRLNLSSHQLPSPGQCSKSRAGIWMLLAIKYASLPERLFVSSPQTRPSHTLQHLFPFFIPCPSQLLLFFVSYSASFLAPSLSFSCFCFIVAYLIITYLIECFTIAYLRSCFYLSLFFTVTYFSKSSRLTPGLLPKFPVRSLPVLQYRIVFSLSCVGFCISPFFVDHQLMSSNPPALSPVFAISLASLSPFSRLSLVSLPLVFLSHLSFFYLPFSISSPYTLFLTFVLSYLLFPTNICSLLLGR